MSITLQRNVVEGTDRFNRVQSHLVNEGRRLRPRRAPLADSGLLRVLIVDDQRDMTDVMAMLVWRWGHDARGTYGGATALRIADRLVPDIVLLDIAMPHMDGFQVAERLRSDARLEDCFLIAMTGYADAAYRLQYLDAGIDLLLIKPVECSLLETLLDLECARLGRSRRERGVEVQPTILSTDEWANDPWDAVPHCNSTITTIL